MGRRKLLLNLFITKNPKFSIFYNYSDGFKSYSASFFNVYIFNDKPVSYKKFLFGIVSIHEDKLDEIFFVASVKYKEILVFDKMDLANYLEKELGFHIFDKDYKNEFDKEVKEDILRENILKALKKIEKILNKFSKEDELFPILKKDLHSMSISFSQLTQSDLYNKNKKV